MPYKFTFDLSKIPRFFFSELAKATYHKDVHGKMGKTARDMIKKFKIQEATGLDLSDAVVLMQDFIDIQAKNLVQREKFAETKKRALFLPHCARKHMDNHCKAAFDPCIPSYKCAGCSTDCLVRQASSYARNKGYDVYVVPGGSCIAKIVKNGRYEGVVGVACGEEARMSADMIESLGFYCQGVPLVKNGCANTMFSMETLAKIL